MFQALDDAIRARVPKNQSAVVDEFKTLLTKQALAGGKDLLQGTELHFSLLAGGRLHVCIKHPKCPIIPRGTVLEYAVLCEALIDVYLGKDAVSSQLKKAVQAHF